MLPDRNANGADYRLSPGHVLRPMHGLRDDMLLPGHQLRSQCPVGPLHHLYSGVDELLLHDFLQSMRHDILRDILRLVVWHHIHEHHKRL